MEWRSKREGLYVYMWLTHFAVQQKLTQHCKPTISQFKKKMGKILFHSFPEGQCPQLPPQHLPASPDAGIGKF